MKAPIIFDCYNDQFYEVYLAQLAVISDSFVYAQDRIRVDGGRLTISNINLVDSGMYQCLAENDNGVIYASAELKVVGKHIYFDIFIYLMTIFLT